MAWNSKWIFEQSVDNNFVVNSVEITADVSVIMQQDFQEQVVDELT